MTDYNFDNEPQPTDWDETTNTQRLLDNYKRLSQSEKKDLARERSVELQRKNDEKFNAMKGYLRERGMGPRSKE